MDDRKRILDMLADGRINAEEAAMLLDQLPGAKGTPPPVYHADETAARVGDGRRMVRVRVHAIEEGNASPTVVNINLPLKAARIAGALIEKALPNQARDALMAEGIDLREMNLVELIDVLAEAGGDIVNVTHEGTGEQVAVRVYVE